MNKTNKYNKSFSIQEQIISGKVKTAKIIKIFESFEKAQITFEELSGIVQATRKHMVDFNINFDVLDMCGTGGDGLNTFNISSISALVCAGAGVPVAKHGNRAASSKFGSADLFEALGVNIYLNKEQAVRCLEKCGFVFLFAPQFHPALKHVKEARTLFGKKTYFNIIGPMLNPAHAAFQVIGVSDASNADIIGQSLINTGSKRATIVHGAKGIDEVSVEGETIIHEFSSDKTKRKYVIRPRDFDLKEYSLSTLKTRSMKENVEICKLILENRAHEPHLNAVLLNAALGMLTFGKAKTMREGIEIARQSISSGKVLHKLHELIAVSNSL
ncbi:anthranilate phosphoribosyltransferase [Candidatus Roizmanbacteria bacterium RIFCSPLOWO2_01_FULL_38_12]|uniref:Anthranilate phosphoribosyltransferase n=1 Tax=Candidatus Roizmanbacteria bacterium RIFCSPLOWO2_01_FULL_38_12 TaxID=1802061 RepID=A0A1F7IXC9_9BACT|nr:MAG: anthranilate phosphoribosyltransferase [Candidatus Roizmanbacteria bacterium RIFCSPHIGHO2_12_FULL_38_13]OGK48017.1 MAG: anthranilate phosphoribosyltransferase [Candidatus Roizmanbacteria bacterium RIFCSPLOWO2_01_FULL_38_12]